MDSDSFDCLGSTTNLVFVTSMQQPNRFVFTTCEMFDLDCLMIIDA